MLFLHVFMAYFAKHNFIPMFRLHLVACLSLFLLNSVDAQKLYGTVRDANGAPLPGASVVADGNNGQFTDAEGKYSLNLTAGDHRVVFSYIGYVARTQSITLTIDDVVLNIALAEDAVLIEDVVVVGYGVQRKKEVTGSIAQVDAKQITGTQTLSFEAVLQGQAAGVQVSQS